MGKKVTKKQGTSRQKQAPVKALPVTLLSGFLV